MRVLLREKGKDHAKSVKCEMRVGGECVTCILSYICMHLIGWDGKWMDRK